MKREELIKYHETLTEEARELMRKKNEDYGTGGDPFFNLREFGELGILVRLSDKLARLRIYIERGTFSVKDESFEDTIQDGINYLVLLGAMKADTRMAENKQYEAVMAESQRALNSYPMQQAALGRAQNFF